MANKYYKYRLKPTKEQQELIIKTFGCCRFIYNKMLEDKINHYKETKQMLNNTPAQYKASNEFLKEVDSLALANEQMHLQTAYKNFFKDPKIGFPKFKSKKKNKKTYTTNNVSIPEKHFVKLPKLGKVRFVEHRQIPKGYIIKSATISLEPSGKFYISILTEYEEKILKITLDKSKAIGLDYSSPDFYIDNKGNKAGYERFYRTLENRLAKEQRILSHMIYGSNNYKKQKIKVAKIHEEISNKRNDFLHKKTTELANNYDYICIEDLNLQSLAKTLHLGKSTNDNGFGMFRSHLSYKMHDRGKQFIVIDKWYPSSKTCNDCGYINHDLQLSDREWICPNCGSIIDRDTNAAKNILQKGLSLV